MRIKNKLSFRGKRITHIAAFVSECSPYVLLISRKILSWITLAVCMVPCSLEIVGVCLCIPYVYLCDHFAEGKISMTSTVCVVWVRAQVSSGPDFPPVDPSWGTEAQWRHARQVRSASLHGPVQRLLYCVVPHATHFSAYKSAVCFESVDKDTADDCRSMCMKMPCWTSAAAPV